MNQPNNDPPPLRAKPSANSGLGDDLNTHPQQPIESPLFISEPEMPKPDHEENMVQAHIESEINSRQVPDRLTTGAQPWRVIMQTGSPEPKVLGMDVHDVTVVGRSDPNDSVVPDLDLAAYGAQSLGVSRRHAILLPSAEGLCMMDLDSTNGTWLNGVYLQPGQKYRVRAGDRVEFGRLRLVVRVVGAMLESGGDGSTTAITRSTPPRK